MVVFIVLECRLSGVILTLVWAQYLRTALLAKCAKRSGSVGFYSSKYVAVQVSVQNTAVK